MVEKEELHTEFLRHAGWHLFKILSTKMEQMFAFLNEVWYNTKISSMTAQLC